MLNLETTKPMEIEKRSFEIISEELSKMGITLPMDEAPIIKRCIHTSADFDYATNLKFSDNAIFHAKEALRNGAIIVTDTQMAAAGINKKALKSAGIEVHNFISDEDIILKSKELEITRSALCMEKARSLNKPVIFAIGNAPTALIKLYDMITKEDFKPELIIGVPVGFVNVEVSKELIMSTNVPYIIAKGRKGGSNIAAAICNAILYDYVGR